MRTAGFITLPSERTLRDYTHFFENKVGFHFEVNDLLAAEAQLSGLDDVRKHVVLVFDDRFQALEKLAAGGKGVQEVATYILVVMVRGLTTSLCFPYAHFATSGVTAEILSSLIWEAVRQIEMVGLHVIGMTADGASPNKKNFEIFLTATRRYPYSFKGSYIYFFQRSTLRENDEKLPIPLIPIWQSQAHDGKSLHAELQPIMSHWFQ